MQLDDLQRVTYEITDSPLRHRHNTCSFFTARFVQVGDKITLADITVASALVYPMKLVMSPEYRKLFPCVTRWFTTCVNQPQFQAVVGTVQLAKEEMTAAGAPAPPKKEKVRIPKACDGPRVCPHSPEL